MTIISKHNNLQNKLVSSIPCILGNKTHSKSKMEDINLIVMHMMLIKECN